MRRYFGWLVWCGCCLLLACTSARSPDMLSQISGVWTEGTANSMIYLNLAGHQKTFAMAATPGIIYPADVTAIDLQNRIVTVNVSFPGKGSVTYAVQPYVFRQVPAGQSGQYRLVMTAPTGRQATLSYVRQLSHSELAAQPTQFAVATGETELEPAAPPTPPAAGAGKVTAAPPATARQSAPMPPVPKPSVAPAGQSTPRPSPPSAPPTAAPPMAPHTPAHALPPPAAAEPPQAARPARTAPPVASPPARQRKVAPALASTSANCSQGTPDDRHRCAGRAFHAADRVLNIRYREIMARLPADRRAELGRQEVQWVIRKRTQCQAQANRTPGGDVLRRTAQLQCWTRMTRQRMGELAHYH